VTTARRRGTVLALAAFVAWIVAPRRPMAPGEDALLGSGAARLQNAIDLYRISFGTFPDSIDDLLSPPDGSDPLLEKEPLDPWGRPYRLKRLPGPSLYIESAGPDGLFEPKDEGPR